MPPARYNFKAAEEAAQQRWEVEHLAKASGDGSRPTRYVLDMFTYPSGEGLHVGHPLSFTASDIITRYRRHRGDDVLHPVGFDAFGLPAENYAIKVGVPPQETTIKNIARFTEQLKALGFSYDWSRQVVTSDPSYYRWTQWLFLKLLEQGLAYRAEAPVNWCPGCQTVLANEQVLADGTCERCSSKVEQKNLTQWFFKITQYADELLAELDNLDWPEPLKAAQRNWIGRSQGHEVDFNVSPLPEGGLRGEGEVGRIRVFTTRLDTIYDATFLVLAPEHPLVASIVSAEQKAAVEAYIAQTKLKSDLQRQETAEKTGVFVGAYAVNPATNEKIPVWIADYVLPHYGTGAIMAVPAHDERDAEFAAVYNLPIVGVETLHATSLPDVGASRVVRYRLRDWLVSRQRYWGAPIPIIHCEKCGAMPVPEDQLPVLLPTDVDFRPTGESPLVRSKTFNEGVKCPKCGAAAKRETDTMDTFVCSSWYFLRYCDPHNEQQAFSPESIKAWMPVDTYIGGAEHATGHLLFSRFVTKALADHPDVKLPFREPFTQYRSQGLILGENNEKMSKSRGNVVNPDEIVAKFGADAYRLYLMFMGPFEDPKPWSTSGLEGCRRFIDRVATLFAVQAATPDKTRATPSASIHRTVEKVGKDIESFSFNTAVSAMMIFLNNEDWRSKLNASSPWEGDGFDRVAAEQFLVLLNPFAPHLAEYCWQLLGHKDSIQRQPWPTFDPALAAGDTVDVAVQVNGKLRATIGVPRGTTEAELRSQALAHPDVARFIGGAEPSRVVVVVDRVVNIVTE